MDILLTTEQIQARIAEMGAQIERDYPGGEGIHLVGVLKGGFMFMADLVRAMSPRVTLDFIAVSSYGKSTKSTGEVRMVKDVDAGLEGRHVIIVEDIVDTGLTLTYLQDILRARGAEVAQDGVPAEQAVAAARSRSRSSTSASRSRIASWSATGSTTRRSTATSPHRGAGRRMKRFEIITEADARVLEIGSTVELAPGGIVTPLARDTLSARRVTVVATGATDPQLPPDLAPVADVRRVAIGSDHSGVALKRALVQHLRGRGLAVTDVGTDGTDPVDYPDIAAAVGLAVARKEADAGIVIDGAGIGSAIAANKIRGIRAAMCLDETTARYSREHNGANVLALGAVAAAGHRRRDPDRRSVARRRRCARPGTSGG